MQGQPGCGKWELPVFPRVQLEVAHVDGAVLARVGGGREPRGGLVDQSRQPLREHQQGEGAVVPASAAQVRARDDGRPRSQRAARGVQIPPRHHDVLPEHVAVVSLDALAKRHGFFALEEPEIQAIVRGWCGGHAELLTVMVQEVRAVLPAQRARPRGHVVFHACAKAAVS